MLGGGGDYYLLGWGLVGGDIVGEAAHEAGLDYCGLKGELFVAVGRNHLRHWANREGSWG